MGEVLGSNSSSSAIAAAINSSNIGFQLLKKHGWKEGTGLGLSEQGRLDPVEAYLKNNKRGLGADDKKIKQKKKKKKKPPPASNHPDGDYNQHSPSTKSKPLSKKQRRLQEFEKRLQEKEFERAFYREFWPENV